MKRSPTSLVLAVLVAAGLGYDAYVHLHLADGFDAVGKNITQGQLFRLEAGLAIAAALAVLLLDHWLAWTFAGLVGLGGLSAVLLYRYVDVGAIGPIPNMYEPVWYHDKTWSAIAEGSVFVLAAARVLWRLSAGSAGGSAGRSAPAAPPR